MPSALFLVRLEVEAPYDPTDWAHTRAVEHALEAELHDPMPPIVRLVNVAAATGDEAVGAATRILQVWYWAEVAELVEYLTAQAVEDELDLEAREDLLVEALDGHQLVIYTRQAEAVLFASDNADYAEEELGEAFMTTEQRAYWALTADVREGLPEWFFDEDHEYDEEDDDDEA